MIDFNGKSSSFPLLSLLSFILDYNRKFLKVCVLKILLVFHIFSLTKKIGIRDQIEIKILIFRWSIRSISIIFFLITLGSESDNKLLKSHDEIGFFLSAYFLLFVGTFVFCWFWIVDGPGCTMTFGSGKLPIITSSFGSAYFSHTSFLYFSNMSWLSIVPGIVTITSHGISRPPWINGDLP